MKFLIDNALSQFVASELRKAGYDASHVHEFNLEQASDSKIFDFAAKNNFTIVSADTDFGTILTLRTEIKPSVIIFRRLTMHHPTQQVSLLLSNLAMLENYIHKGSLIVIEEKRIRVRLLPIIKQSKEKGV